MSAVFTYKKGHLCSKKHRLISCCSGKHASEMHRWEGIKYVVNNFPFFLTQSTFSPSKVFKSLILPSSYFLGGVPGLGGMAGESPGLLVLCMVRKVGSSVGSQGCTTPLMAQRFRMCGSDFQSSVHLDPGDHEVFIWRDGRSKHLDRPTVMDQLCWGSCACFCVASLRLQMMRWKRLWDYLVQFCPLLCKLLCSW